MLWIVGSTKPQIANYVKALPANTDWIYDTGDTTSGLTVTSDWTTPIPRQTDKQHLLFFLTTTCRGRHLSAWSRFGTGSSDSCPTVLTNLLIAASNMLSVEVTAKRQKYLNALKVLSWADPGVQGTRTLGQISFIFMQSSGKIGQTTAWR